MQRNFKLSEKPPSQVKMARIAHVTPHTMRSAIIMLLKMTINRGYEIVEPIPLGLFNEVTGNDKKHR